MKKQRLSFARISLALVAFLAGIVVGLVVGGWIYTPDTAIYVNHSKAAYNFL